MKPRLHTALALPLIALIAGCPGQVETPPDGAPAHPVAEEHALEGDWPRVFANALGGEITLDRPPRRVVSLSTGITETIFALGAGDRLVGRLSLSTYPPEVLDVPEVGGLVDPSLEAIVAREPDLVVTERGTPRDFIDAVEGVGIPVIAYDPTSIPEVISMIREVGRLLGVGAEAGELAGDLESRIATVKARGDALGRGQGRPSALLLVALDPVYAAGEGHFVDDMIYLAGGVNAGSLVPGSNAAQWPSLSMEAVVELDPDIVVIAMMHHEDWSTFDAGEEFRDRPGWKDLSATRGGRVYTIDPDLAVRAGPRLIDALEQMADIIEDAVAGGRRNG